MADEDFTVSTLLMDRGVPLGNSVGPDGRRAVHVKIKNNPDEPIAVTGTSGGGVAMTQVRNSSNVWTDVGYSAGNLNMPIQGSVTANIGTTNGLALDTSIATGNTTLSSINTKTPTLGQKPMTGSAPVTMASDQTPIPTNEIAIASGSNGAKSIGASFALLSVGGSNLTNRTLLIVSPQTRDLFWGFTTGVTTTNGQIIQKGATATFNLKNDAVNIYAISSAANDVRISEAVQS